MASNTPRGNTPAGGQNARMPTLEISHLEVLALVIAILEGNLEETTGCRPCSCWRYYTWRCSPPPNKCAWRKKITRVSLLGVPWLAVPTLEARLEEITRVSTLEAVYLKEAHLEEAHFSETSVLVSLPVLKKITKNQGRKDNHVSQMSRTAPVAPATLHSTATPVSAIITPVSNSEDLTC